MPLLPLALAAAVCCLSCRTPGFTGADLQNLMNEAAILAARRDLKEISKEEIADALERIIAGEGTGPTHAGHAVLCGLCPALQARASGQHCQA